MVRWLFGSSGSIGAGAGGITVLGGAASVVVGSEDGPVATVVVATDDDVVVSLGGSVVLVDVGAGSVVVDPSALVGGAGVKVGSADSSDEQPIAIRLTITPPTIRGAHGARIPAPAGRLGLRARRSENGADRDWRSIAYTRPLSVAPATTSAPIVASAMAGANGNPERPVCR